jgi:hypothetical protein
VKEWGVSPKVHTWCAFCGGDISQGARVLLVYLPSIQRPRYYCEDCAATRWKMRPTENEAAA